MLRSKNFVVFEIFYNLLWVVGKVLYYYTGCTGNKTDTFCLNMEAIKEK